MTIEDILQDPDKVGAAEYRAIHELLIEADDIDNAIAIADEFVNYGKALGQQLRRHRSETNGNAAEDRKAELEEELRVLTQALDAAPNGQPFNQARYKLAEWLGADLALFVISIHTRGLFLGKAYEVIYWSCNPSAPGGELAELYGEPPAEEP